MKVLLLTDIHGNVENLGKIMKKEDYDAVLCAGDLSDANEFSDYEGNLEDVIEQFNEEGKLVRAVPGNMDPEEVCIRHLIDNRINLHKKIHSFEEFEAVGFGGGKTPFDTPFEPEGSEIKNALSTLFDRMSEDKRVAVVHQPPADTLLDIVESEHVGSKEVRELYEEKNFDLVLTGHIHESKGTDNIGDTILVNPGAVTDGFYGVATINEDIEVELKQI